MGEPVDSGKVRSEHTVTKKFKDEKGEQHTVTTKKDAVTRKETIKVDGKQINVPRSVPFNPGNYQTLTLALLMDIRGLLTKLLNSTNEINFRMDKVNPIGDEDNKKLKDEAL